MKSEHDLVDFFRLDAPHQIASAIEEGSKHLDREDVDEAIDELARSIEALSA